MVARLAVSVAFRPRHCHVNALVNQNCAEES